LACLDSEAFWQKYTEKKMEHCIAAIQMVTPPDLSTNLEAAAKLIAVAAAQGAKLVLLPEVFAVLEGGPMRQYGELEDDFGAPIQGFLASVAKKHKITLVGGTIPLISRPGRQPSDSDYLISDGRVRPASLVFEPSGERIARYDKIHLFDVLLGDEKSNYSESKSYEAGEELVVVSTELGELGLSVCYDLRFPELYRELFHRGAQIMTVPAAFTKVTGQAHWETLLRARAIENQCYVVAAGQGGRHSADRETWGHSMIIDPWGRVLDSIGTGEGYAIAEIELGVLKKARKMMPIAAQTKL
jgi:predicted amidohydrolase